MLRFWERLHWYGKSFLNNIQILDLMKVRFLEAHFFYVLFSAHIKALFRSGDESIGWQLLFTVHVDVLYIELNIIFCVHQLNIFSRPANGYIFKS
ncbi:hypothetical protein PEPS_39650 (plasmid) [Persicobacter psychrovividus]|uniref:Uncharacterized protein n=1 Tax=Persicobacter psychrovividus TaxID=387638 RepID=A0ABN6LF12_9BACT|nr:hypothetical protein PEPS_39650 [Persicobacter psychrovividus]